MAEARFPFASAPECNEAQGADDENDHSVALEPADTADQDCSCPGPEGTNDHEDGASDRPPEADRLSPQNSPHALVTLGRGFEARQPKGTDK